MREDENVKKGRKKRKGERTGGRGDACREKVHIMTYYDIEL